MARKRLSPPQDTFLGAAPETKSLSGPFGPLPRSTAPIAQVAGDSATAAALREVVDELHNARIEGRLIQRLPLTSIEADHLVRDRLDHDAEDMRALQESLRARGQQTPIEVVDLGEGRYGLISGWRRLQALIFLHDQTGQTSFATVQALLRRPENSAQAYLAMVEENEIRVGLGHYERARIAAHAARIGVYRDSKTALQHLFQNASRAKRSKIGSFITIYDQLEGCLRFPAAIPERLGLALAHALEADATLALRILKAVAVADSKTAADEQAVLARMIAPQKTDKVQGAGRDANSSPPEELAPGIWLQPAGPPHAPRYTLHGPGVDAGFRDRLAAWLRTQG